MEILSYFPGNQLNLHQDQDSIYTFVVMLSEPNSFTGGDFVINPKNKITHGRVDGKASNLYHSSPTQGDAILFDSNAAHGVQAISFGERWVLVLELWIYEDAGYDLRPSAKDYSDRLIKPTIMTSVDPFPPTEEKKSTNWTSDAMLDGNWQLVATRCTIICMFLSLILNLLIFQKIKRDSMASSAAEEAEATLDDKSSKIN